MLWFTLDLYRHQQLKVYEWHLAKTNLETTKPHRTKITATACKFCLCTTHYRRFKVNRWRRLNQIKNIGQGLKFDRFFFKCTEDGYVQEDQLDWRTQMRITFQSQILTDGQSKFVCQNIMDSFNLCLLRVFVFTFIVCAD